MKSRIHLLNNPIRVRVLNGRAEINGVVDSLRERALASRLARASGAHRVVNLLQIEPTPAQNW